MPIANCILRNDLSVTPSDEGALIDAWASDSGVGAGEMTINLIRSDRQLGSKCAVMAFLYLPSLWGTGQTRSLQLGLARAFQRELGLERSDVQVITTIVDSGDAVEDGELRDW